MTITVSSGTTTVPSSTSGSYLVESSGTLDVDSDGTISGLVTVESGGGGGAGLGVGLFVAGLPVSAA